MKLGKIFCCSGPSCSDTSAQVRVQTSQIFKEGAANEDRPDQNATTLKSKRSTTPPYKRSKTPPLATRPLTPKPKITAQPTTLTNKDEILNMISDGTKTLDKFWPHVSEDLKQDQGFIHKILENFSSKDQAAKLELFWKSV